MKSNVERREETQYETLAKKRKDSRTDNLLSKHIFHENLKSHLATAFRNNEDFEDKEAGIKLSKLPFKHCVIHNLIEDYDYLIDLKEVLMSLDFVEKSNDLYKFSQSTNDLKVSQNKIISKLRNTLYNDLLHWIANITKIELNEHSIDMSCAKYTNTDVLLCHDDQLEERKIAYIFYLVPSWSHGDGGSLDFFNIDDDGQPDKIVKSLVPVWNSFVFFEVTTTSFHQVSEILSNKTRLSISGWFHGSNTESSVCRLRNDVPRKQSPIHIKDETLISWINPMYLQTDVVKDIRQRFEENSEIELKDFLLEEKYERLVKEFKDVGRKWEWIGPANKRRCEKAPCDSLSGTIRECYELFKSLPMFKLLTTLTGLKLSNVDTNETRNDEDDDDDDDGERKTCEQLSGEPCCHGDVYRWSHGCYTLIHDNDPEVLEMALDAMLFFNCDDWKEEFGGYTTYLDKDENEELLTIQPFSNSLDLVYRDTGTTKFVKYINNRCKIYSCDDNLQNNYYNIMYTYFE